MLDSVPPPTEILRRTHAQQWRTDALDAIAAQGLIIPKNTPPKKSFKENQRFFVQKCSYPDGTKVIVKISAPTPRDREALKKEAYWDKRIQELAEEARQNGKEIPIRFPEVITSFTYGNYTGIITRYVNDDWDGFKTLTQEEREKIILKITEGMQMLPIPHEELTKSEQNRLLPIITADFYPQYAKNYLGELAASGYINDADKHFITDVMEKNVALIASIPMHVSHGDFHTGNFRYTKDPHSGDPIITLFDLELISLKNGFVTIAESANYFNLAACVYEHPEREHYPDVLANIVSFQELFSFEHMIRQIEERFVMSRKDSKEAQLVYRLMRINDCYKKFADALSESRLPNNTLNKVEVDAYKKIFKEQVTYIENIVSTKGTL